MIRRYTRKFRIWKIEDKKKANPVEKNDILKRDSVAASSNSISCPSTSPHSLHQFFARRICPGQYWLLQQIIQQRRLRFLSTWNPVHPAWHATSEGQRCGSLKGYFCPERGRGRNRGYVERMDGTGVYMSARREPQLLVVKTAEPSVRDMRPRCALKIHSWAPSMTVISHTGFYPVTS